MVTVKTDCNHCIHRNVCRNEGKVDSYAKKLRNTNFGKGPNDDYDWNTISESDHIDIEFSCKDYSKDASVRPRPPKKVEKLIDPCSPCVCVGTRCEHCMFGYRSAETRHSMAVRLINNDHNNSDAIASNLKLYNKDWEKYVGDEEVKKDE